MSSQPWTIAQASDLYSISHWGDHYFAINEQGHVCVKPSSDSALQIDLYEIAQTLSASISFPVLLRFPDILRDRIKRLQQAFDSSCQQFHYNGRYTPVYPIKVNQQGSVVENIIAAERVGLEAGSKPELLAILGLSQSGTIICNGYKDRAYIRMALIGSVMASKSGEAAGAESNGTQQVYIVIEKLSELALITAEAAKLNIKPRLGVRVRLSSISAGKWQNSGGEKSKFGLHANELLKLIDELKQADMLSCLQLLHFHMGSQIANVHDIKLALKEAGQFFVQLHRLGAPINIIDTGGGLGVDYDGSASRRDCSMNYNLSEYAHNIVKSFANLCDQHCIAHPDIVTESGRAITAHHAVLLSNVTEIESPCADLSADTVTLPHGNIVEYWHNLQYDIGEARTLFIQGDRTLAQLAQAERHYIESCYAIKTQLHPRSHSQQEILQELDEKLADKLFCNFSLFQSLPDIWGIDQVFPIMPIHRLHEEPNRRGVLQDLTCDSDGRIDRYVDHQNIENSLPIHAISADEYYIIGFFMIGAYQEILGDMHNLFGDTHSYNIELTEEGYCITDFLAGEQVTDLLEYVHIDSSQLIEAYRAKLEQTNLSQHQQAVYFQELADGLNAYTYLEK